MLERITPTWDKRRFPLVAERFADAAGAVRGVFVLDADTLTAAQTQSLAPADALIRLTTLTYANYLLTMEQRAAELALLGEFVRAVPVRRLMHRGVAMGRVCDMVERDVFDR